MSVPLKLKSCNAKSTWQRTASIKISAADFCIAESIIKEIHYVCLRKMKSEMLIGYYRQAL